MGRIRTSHRIMIVLAGAVGVALVWAGWQFPARADGSDVAQKLTQAHTVVSQLTGTVGKDGAYSLEPNAGSVPFLGADPTQDSAGVFSTLNALNKFNDFPLVDTDPIAKIAEVVEKVDVALGGDHLSTPDVECGGTCDGEDTVADVTSIKFRLTMQGSLPSKEVAFSSLGLPSIGFLPQDGMLDVVLNWTVDVGFVADGNGLRLEAAPGDAHELVFSPKITLRADPITVNLGALIVTATPIDDPGFKGNLNVDIGGVKPTFGFDAAVEARWHMAPTAKSPLSGVAGDLHISWNLTGSGINPAGLTVALENMTIRTSEFVGKGIAGAAATVREITHPIRTAASPLLEPIPGLSDLSKFLGQGNTSLLRLAEYEGLSSDFREILQKLIVVDDIAGALGGGNDVNLGNLTLVGGAALDPKGLPDNVAVIKSLADQCDLCKEAMDSFLGKVNGAGTPGFRFDFPVLKDPASLAGLLFGRDVDLFTFDTGRIGPKTPVNIPIVSILIFSVSIQSEKDFEASIDLRGGFDTKGIIDALKTSDTADLLNGLYIKNPEDGRPVVRLYSDVGLGVSTIGKIFSITGGPKADVWLEVPPGGDEKLRPALVGEGIGCELLKSPNAKADIGVHITATIRLPIVPNIEKVIASHQFLTKEDLCQKQLNNDAIAVPDGRTLRIKTGDERGVPGDEPDTIKVFMRHNLDDPNKPPTQIVVSVNNNRRGEFAAADFDNIRYDSTGDIRPVHLQVVKTDGKPFEKQVDVLTGDGADDILVDTQKFAKVVVEGGNDKVIATAGSGDDGTKFIAGGTGDDYLQGGDAADFIGGEEGNDSIQGGGGADHLFGGAGDDTLMDTSVDHNCMVGNEGNDQLLAGRGNDELSGDEGGTFILVIVLACGNDLKPHEAGSADGGVDLIVTGGGADKVWAGNGTDRVQVLGDDVADEWTDPNHSVYDANVIVHAHGGDDLVNMGDGSDFIHGGPANDTINAGHGANEVYGGVNQDMINAGDGDDKLFGDNGKDKCEPSLTSPTPVAEPDTVGDADNVNGGGGLDRIALENGNDVAHGGEGNDVMCGHAGDDDVNGEGGEDFIDAGTGNDKADGGDGDDDVYGRDGDDAVRGGNSNDDVFGNNGADSVFGDEGDDRLVGGSPDATTEDSGTAADGFGDHMWGGSGHDVMLGDNGTIDAATRAVALLAATTIGQPDLMYGEGEHDFLYGEHGPDDLFGGGGDDHAEGNDDADDVYGESGNDDLVGGTTERNQPDTGDNVQGGDGHDVLAGDNTAVERFGPFGAWTTDDLVDRPGTADDVLDVVRRRVTLFDLATVAAPNAGDGVSGADILLGGDGHDIMYGQSGADEMQGGAHDDYLEGGEGTDHMYGQAGQDDLIGGTGRAVSDDPSTAADGRLDDAETLFGDDDPALRPLSAHDDYDVIAGDNATVVRNDPYFNGVSGTGWDVNSYNAAIHRTLFLYDVGVGGAPAAAGTGAGDRLLGQAADDVIYGQAGADSVEGGDGDDYMEGNEGSDTILGLAGNDDIIGGTGRINTDPPTGSDGRLESAETLSGGDGFDVMAGDNAIIRRVLGPNGEWLANTFNGGVQHERVQLLDMASLANPDVPGDVYGDDTMAGDADDDVMYGQGGNDPMNGNDGEDYMEGNAGADVMEGDANRDDMIGGTGRVNQDPPTGGNGRFDDDDLMYGADETAGEGGDGGTDYDTMLGDNGVVERPLTPLPEGDWQNNTFNDGVQRTFVMLDIELAAAAAVDGRLHGDDTMFGNGDDDLMRGQGGNDTMHGNDGDDDMEGNFAVDHMFGDADQDDMLGGSRSAGWRDAGDFLYGGDDHDTVLGDNAQLVRPLTPLPAGDWQVQDYGHVFGDAVAVVDQQRVIRNITNLDHTIGLTSGSDVVHGQAGDDDLYGQLDDTGDTNNGAGAVPVTENCDMGALNMPDDPFFTGEPVGTFTVAGDLVCGGVGEDAVLGDQGVVTSFVEKGNQIVLTHNGAPFITETSRVENSLARKVVLEGIAIGGDDVVLGDDPTNRVRDGVVPAGLGAHDSIHAGAGADIASGGQGDDFLFGDDGNDAMWGGDHDDHSWGGYERDHIDVLPRTTDETGIGVDDPITWFFFAADDPDTVDNPATEAREGYDGYRGFDIIYGGWDQDAMQANEGDNGPVEGDRLVDWVGTYNAYYLCPATYGEFVSTRQMSPSLLLYLQQQAEADGATDVLGGPRASDSGFDELALVYKKDIQQNANPVHPDTPAHFTCR